MALSVPKTRSATTKVRLDGADEDFIYFSVPSSSNPREEYTVAIWKRSPLLGWIECTCPDAEYRMRGAYLDDSSNGVLCKHGRQVLREINKVLGDKQQ